MKYQKPALVRMGTFREVTQHKAFGAGDFHFFRKKRKDKPTVS